MLLHGSKQAALWKHVARQHSPEKVNEISPKLGGDLPNKSAMGFCVLTKYKSNTDKFNFMMQTRLNLRAHTGNVTQS